MKYYKHQKTGEVFAYELEEERQIWGVPELVEMTSEEVTTHLNPPTNPETLATTARAKRDALLAASDWIIIRSQELGQPVPTIWTTYRQMLRDIPQQQGFPQNIIWPDTPEST